MKLLLFACIMGSVWAHSPDAPPPPPPPPPPDGPPPPPPPDGPQLPRGPHTQVGAFIYVETLLSWNDAQSYCVNVFGTSLATVDSQSDIDLVSPVCDPLKDAGDGHSCPAFFYLPAPPPFNAFNCGCWIGLFREPGTEGDADGPWQWADGFTPYTFRNWGPGIGKGAPQPDNRSGEDECVSLLKGFAHQPDGSWNDRPCDGVSGGMTSQYFFCNGEHASDNAEEILNDDKDGNAISISLGQATQTQFGVLFIAMVIFANIICCYKYKQKRKLVEEYSLLL